MRRVSFLAVLLAVAVGALVLGSGPLGTGAQTGTPVAADQSFVGAWEQTGPTTAAATWVEFVSDGEGNFLVTVTDSVEMTLGTDGDSWSGPFSSTSADPTGNVLFVGGGTVEAKRITVQPLATPLATPAA